jgi:isopentenyl-diphosphate delta-isomerase
VVQEELIVLVAESGAPIGSAEKWSSHHADTPLHLAFSCYVFDGQGRFLATRRSLRKKVWPGVWTNSVCGHPGPGEALVDAIRRRLAYELGMAASGFEVVLPQHRYVAPPFEGIVENEYCPVFVARADSEPRPNPVEVEAFEWVRWADFVAAAQADSDDAYSWWCKNQLREMREQGLVDGLSGPEGRSDVAAARSAGAAGRR